MAAITMVKVMMSFNRSWYLGFNRRRSAIGLPLLAVLSPLSIHAAEWKLTPRIDFSEVYSDNVRLQSSGLEQSAYITNISPGFNLTATGDNLNLQANYTMQSLHYSDVANIGTKTNNLVNANGTATLAKDLFFLDGTTNISQQTVNPLGQQTTNDYNVTDNRVEVRTYSFSPYFRRRLNEDTLAELRYTRDSVNSSQTSTANSYSDQMQFSLKNGAAFKVWTWGIRYSDQKIYYPQLAPVQFESSLANLTYKVASQLELTGSAGYEHNNYASLTGKSGGTSWSLGLNWTPSERTNVSVSAGHRYFGATYALTASYRARMSVFSAGYNDDVTTTRNQFLLPVTTSTSAFLNQLWQTSIPDATVRQQLVDSFIRSTGLPSSLSQSINTFTNQIFLQKNAQASIATTGSKNTVLLTLYNTSRESLSSASLDSLSTNNNILQSLQNKTRQTGLSALWNWQMSPRTNASFGVGKTRVLSLDTGIYNTNKSLYVTFSRQLQQKLKVSLDFRRTLNDTNQATGNFQENAITLLIMQGF